MSNQLTEEKIRLLKDAGYSNKAIELYANNINVGIIENADAETQYTGPCGDTCKIYLKINDCNIVEDSKFQYLGCPASAACGSAVTQMIKNKSLVNVKKITEEDVIKELGGLPGDECHCETLVLTTLSNAIKKYENNKTNNSNEVKFV